MATLASPALPQPALARDQFMDRVLKSTAGALEVFTAYIGDKLGLYTALAQAGPMNSRELAVHTRTSERYIREWLEQQTVVGYIRCVDPDLGPKDREYYLPAEHAEVLTDPDSLNYLAPLFQLMSGAVKPLSQVVDAFRTGNGVPYEEYGELHEGQARMNRAMFLQQLGPEWLGSMPDVYKRLSDSRPAYIADIGCGHGWSTIGMAASFPNAIVHGFDNDEISIQRAKNNARSNGLESRVQFWTRDAADPELSGRYYLAIAIECLHDMSNPVGALRSMRRLVHSRGTVVVIDERVGHSFTPRGTDMEWLMYGCSVLHCLPVGMAEQPSAGTGTVMRAGTVAQYAREAGFEDIEILPVDHPLFRFYRLID